MTAYHGREAALYLNDALENLPVVALTGPRQSGKSTFLRDDPAFVKRRYITLDDFAALETARRNPDSLFASDEPITIDEAQRCPELFVAIKRSVDRNRMPGRILLGGSANFALLKSITESLAGRAIYLTMLPFTRREIRQKINKPPKLIEWLGGDFTDSKETQDPIDPAEIVTGGMPPVALKQIKNPNLWFLGYEQTYLERDVREFSQVSDITIFRNVLKLTALRTGQILNESALGRDAKLSATTTSRYISLLETSYIIHRIPPFIKNRASRLVKSPKVYTIDSGLACHLTGVAKNEFRSGDALAGAVVETYVFQNIHGILASHLPAAEVMFWNIQGRNEVDFIITHKRRTIAIEVKWASQFDDRDLAGLRALERTGAKIDLFILAYNGKSAVALDHKTFAVPISYLIS